MNERTRVVRYAQGPLDAEMSATRAAKARETKEKNRTKLVEAMRPYMGQLRKRWGEVAKNGETTTKCPLCKGIGVAFCYACPVFGESVFGFGKGKHCEDFMPLSPACIKVTHLGVHFMVSEPDRCRVRKDNKSGVQVTHHSPKQRAREYGRKMLELLDEVQDEQARVAAEVAEGGGEVAVGSGPR